MDESLRLRSTVVAAHAIGGGGSPLKALVHCF
jgi:hypothetical protein